MRGMPGANFKVNVFIYGKTNVNKNIFPCKNQLEMRISTFLTSHNDETSTNSRGEFACL